MTKKFNSAAGGTREAEEFLKRAKIRYTKKIDGTIDAEGDIDLTATGCAACRICRWCGSMLVLLRGQHAWLARRGARAGHRRLRLRQQ